MNVKNENKNMRENLSYLKGVVDSDGCLSKTRDGAYSIQLGVKDREYAEKFRKILEEETGEEVNLYDYDDFYQVNKANKELYEEIMFSDRTKAQPEPYLQALFDGDGNIQKKTNRKTAYDIRLRMTNPDVVNTAQKKLQEIGIEEENIHSFTTEKGLSENKVYGLKIGRRKAREKYAEKVGFEINRKNKELLKSLKTTNCIMCGEDTGSNTKKYCSNNCHNKQRRLRRKDEGVNKKPTYSIPERLKE